MGNRRGTWDDMAMLYKKVHEYGMNLGIDVVINHSSILNPLLKHPIYTYQVRIQPQALELYMFFRNPEGHGKL